MITQASESITVPPPPPVGAYTYPEAPMPHFVAQPTVLSGHETTNPITFDNDDKGKPDENSKLLSMLDERLKMVEGFSYHRAMNSSEPTLVPGLVIPPKFKVPKFEKYNGTKCSQDHLLSYVRKMATHTSDDKLMIHFFQDSLTGVASRWYNQLDSTRIRTWTDLAKAFIAQYKHMTDLAPDRLTLQTMERKSTETFKEYAQRWMNTAAQVNPPLTERETNFMFLETLKALYYDRLLASVPKAFSDMVVAGELIEKAIKSGKIDSGDTANTKKGQSSKKKEGEANNVSTYQPPHYTHPYNPSQQPHGHQYPYQQSSYSYQRPPTSYQHPTSNYIGFGPTFQPIPMTQTFSPRPNIGNNQRQFRPYTKTRIDPIPYTYTALLPQLLQQGLLEKPRFTKTYNPPYPSWYKENAHCDYHNGTAGHSTEDCMALKIKVQELVKEGKLGFNKNQQPNVGQNPLPNHGEASVSMVGMENEEPSDLDNLIFKAASDTELDNWSTMEIPTIFSDKM